MSSLIATCRFFFFLNDSKYYFAILLAATVCDLISNFTNSKEHMTLVTCVKYYTSFDK